MKGLFVVEQKSARTKTQHKKPMTGRKTMLGDQLALIATPWLVLQLTGDPLILGTVLALVLDDLKSFGRLPDDSTQSPKVSMPP